MFNSGTEIILDTNAIKEIVDKHNRLGGEFMGKFTNWIKEKCHVLVIPKPLKKEISGVLKSSTPLLLNLTVTFQSKLRGKYSEEDAREERIDEELERRLKKGGADKEDVLVVKTAIKRSKNVGRNIIIITNDKAIHNVGGLLRDYNVRVVATQEFWGMFGDP